MNGILSGEDAAVCSSGIDDCDGKEEIWLIRVFSAGVADEVNFEEAKIIRVK